MFNRLLEDVAADIVSPLQRGFVRGRSIVDNVLDVEASMCEFLYDMHADPTRGCSDSTWRPHFRRRPRLGSGKCWMLWSSPLGFAEGWSFCTCTAPFGFWSVGSWQSVA